MPKRNGTELRNVPLAAKHCGTFAALARCPHTETCKTSLCAAHAQLREIVPTWEGAWRILATLAVDPARQGQRLIKVKHCIGWECQRPVTPKRKGDLDICGHDTPEADGQVPTTCEECGYWRLKRVPMSVPYLAEFTPGGPIADPYRASNFRMELKDWFVIPLFGIPAWEIVHERCFNGHSFRTIAEIVGWKTMTVHDMFNKIRDRYDAP